MIIREAAMKRWGLDLEKKTNDWCGGDPLWNQWFHSGNLRWDLKKEKNEMWKKRELGPTNYNIVIFWLVNLTINEQKVRESVWVEESDHSVINKCKCDPLCKSFYFENKNCVFCFVCVPHSCTRVHNVTCVHVKERILSF